ncbi:MAG TPA: helix-turn-helix transcriptional regulator [Pyrinomonadaceae bacterium]|jgi:transcriptional regulator with XRE-family HTH domain|nr:helix-turn-helix transcriptional regulator [Pyrinomonadaceae bacterium]
MGKKPRPRPKRLAEKLLAIRNALGLSQSELFWRLDIEEFTEMKRVSDFETGRSEPPLPVLLRYARLVRISTDVLIDDEMDLPARLKG